MKQVIKVVRRNDAALTFAVRGREPCQTGDAPSPGGKIGPSEINWAKAVDFDMRTRLTYPVRPYP